MCTRSTHPTTQLTFSLSVLCGGKRQQQGESDGERPPASTSITGQIVISGGGGCARRLKTVPGWLHQSLAGCRRWRYSDQGGCCGGFGVVAVVALGWLQGAAAGICVEMGKYACYVVFKGRNTGIFSTWDECKAQIDHFSGASYKGYYSVEEAIVALSRVSVVGGRIRTTTQILKELKHPEVGEQSTPPNTFVSPPSAPAKVDDWELVKNLIGLLLLALIALVIVVIAVVVKVYLL